VADRSARVVGVIPAAGRAERLQPLGCSKEVLPIGGRPVLEYVVERMRAASPDEIRVVTRPDKTDVAALAEGLGLRVVRGEPPTLAASLALGSAGLDTDAIVLFGFPDTIWEPVDGFARLVAAFGDAADVVLGLFDWDEAERSQRVEVDDGGRVRSVDTSPPPGRALVWGCAVIRAGALAELATHDHPGELFDVLARRGRAHGLVLSSQFADVGTKAALAAASERFATR
jgi:NDP-sugar pyrophosphorylase family protein